MSLLSDAAAPPLIARDRVFSGKRRFDARNERLLQLVAPVIGRIAQADERVLFIAPALAPVSLVERVVFGSALDHFARCVLVVTDRRIVQVGSDRQLTKCETVSQVWFAGVRHAKASALTLTLSVRYRNGRRETWSRLTRHDLRLLRAALAERRAADPSDAYDDRERLCPRCFAPLAATTPACANCRVPFKSRLRATAAALLPGGGYLYGGRLSGALLDIAVHAFLALAALGAYSLARSAIIASAARTYLWTGCAFAVWKLLVIAHARRLVSDLLPDENAGRAAAAARRHASAVWRLLMIGRARLVSNLPEVSAVRTSAAARDAAERLRDYARREYVWVESAPPPMTVATETLFGLPVARSQSDAATRAEQVRRLERLAPLLRRTLEEGEVVLFTSSGSPRFVFADLVSPIMVVLLMKRCVYVFTDRRIVHVPSTVFGRARQNLGAIWYADVVAHRATGGYTFGAIINLGIELMMRSGEREHVARLPLDAFRTATALVERLAGSGRRRIGRRMYLCPSCGAAPDGNVCRACGTRFRSGAAARLFALLVPGGGYVYAGYAMMGVCAAAVELGLFTNGLFHLITGNWRAAAVTWGLAAWQKLAAVAHATVLARERVPVDGRQHRYLRG